MNEVRPEKLGDKYILLDIIGTGGMAEVYRGKLIGDKGFEKLIVIKKLLDHVAKDQEMVDHFTNEARLAALLQHENICHIYDYGEIDKAFFIAMEYLFGKDLSSVFSRVRELEIPFTPELALRIMVKICEGMEYAHSLADLQDNPLNLIHRDLTPQNIFLTYEGRIKILDFGIAKSRAFDNRTQVGIVKGKMNYMSPEQVAGEQLDRRSDIFSMGILLYEMLSGTQMYTGDTGTIIRRSVQVDFTPLTEVTPDLPVTVYHIVERALEKNQEKRYQSCDEMKGDLTKYLATLSQEDDTEVLQDFIRSIFVREYELEKANAKRIIQSPPPPNPQLHYDKTVFIEQPPLPEAVADKEIKYAKRNNMDDPLKQHEQAQPEIKLGPARPSKKSTEVKNIQISRPDAGKKTSSFGTISIAQESTSKTPVRRRQKTKKTIKLDTEKFKKFAIPLVIGIVLACIAIVYLNTIQKNIDYFSDLTPPSPPPILNTADMTNAAKQFELVKLQLKGETAMNKGNLFSPENENAWYYYAHILQLDPSNTEAREAIKKIVETIATHANEFINTGGHKEAAKLIVTGLAVDPENGKLLQLKMQLENK